MTRKELINSPEYKKENAYIDAWRDGYNEAVEETCKWLKKEFKAWNRIGVEVMLDEYYNEIMGKTTMMDTYEKKYKELVGKIEKAYLYAQTDSTKAVLEEIRPELAESEDERIRKALVKAVSGTLKGNKLFGTNVTREEALAWLEKQDKKPSVLSNSLNIGKDLQVDGFDAELNALLKKYEHLPKEEILGCLNFYVLVLGKEMDEQQ